MADVRASIPGWLDALKAERSQHETAFAYPHDEIAGVPVRHISLIDIARLEWMGNRFGNGDFPTWPELAELPQVQAQAVEFLCYLHVKQPKRCKTLFNMYRRFKYKRLDKQSLYLGLVRYFNDTFMDSLGEAEGRKKEPVNRWSNMVEYADLIAKEYGWTDDYVLNMPYRRLIQFVRKIVHRENPKYPISSIADRVIARYLENQRGSA